MHRPPVMLRWPRTLAPWRVGCPVAAARPQSPLQGAIRSRTQRGGHPWPGVACAVRPRGRAGVTAFGKSTDTSSRAIFTQTIRLRLKVNERPGLLAAPPQVDRQTFNRPPKSSIGRTGSRLHLNDRDIRPGRRRGPGLQPLRRPDQGDLRRTIPGVNATTFADAGHTKHPAGVTIQADDKATRWQVVATSAPGDRFERPEAEPVPGAKPAAPGQADAQPGTPARLEAALAAALLAATPARSQPPTRTRSAPNRRRRLPTAQMVPRSFASASLSRISPSSWLRR
ncbi:hypothetical protein ABH931_002692 [Streptacidiphilus sp. MAP12-33]